MALHTPMLNSPLLKARVKCCALTDLGDLDFTHCFVPTWMAFFLSCQRCLRNSFISSYLLMRKVYWWQKSVWEREKTQTNKQTKKLPSFTIFFCISKIHENKVYLKTSCLSTEKAPTFVSCRWAKHSARCSRYVGRKLSEASIIPFVEEKNEV